MNVLLQQLLAFFRRNPFAIACSLIAVLLWIGNYFIWTQHQELAAGHQTIQRNGEDMMQALTNHGRVTSELASVKEALAFINQHLVNEGDLPENMGYFYQLETTSRLHLDSLNQLSSMPPAPDQVYKTVPFSLRTTGSYRQVLRFLRELESGPRLYKIQTYALTQGGAGASPSRSPGEITDAPAQVTLELTLEVLARP